MALDDAIRELVREVLREELRPLLREELRSVLQTPASGLASQGPVYLTTKEAARVAKVTTDTITEWIRASLLPAGRLPNGGEYRIRNEDLAGLLATAGTPHPVTEPQAEARRLLSAVQGKVRK